MRIVVGVVFMVIGAVQLVSRQRLARANSASNREMFNGHLGGPKVTAMQALGNGITGVAAMVIGVVVLVTSL